MQIVPTIFEKEFAIASEKIKIIKDLSRWIQVDVTDGFFTQGKTFELELLNKLENETRNNLLDMHLMVKEPIKWIEKCNFVGASRIIGHVEMMNDRQEFIDKLKDMGLEAGLAFDTDSEIKDIPTETDLVLLMGRKSGFQAADFEEETYERIKKLVKLREENGLDFEIGIDGGINKEIIEKLKILGVSIAYCGGAIFNGNVINNWEELIKSL